jgi:DNA-binding transcriptional regulator GbsR (MarR family)
VLFFEEVVQVFGVQKSVGQIYGLLYASPLPLCFSDIVEKLEISKGSASQGLTLLRSLGAINVAEPVGDKSQFSNTASQIALRASRSVAYEPELSLRRLVSGVLRERIAPMAASGPDRLTRLRELAEQDAEGNEFYLDRAKQLITWRRRLKTVIPILSALLGPKTRK